MVIAVTVLKLFNRKVGVGLKSRPGLDGVNRVTFSLYYEIIVSEF